MSSPKVLVSILNWNNSSGSKKAVKSLQDCDYENLHILVVDNGSTEPFKMKGVDIIRNDENLGFSGGHNVAIKKSIAENYDAVMLFNHDAWIESDAISKLVKELFSDSQYAAAGPTVLTSGPKKEIWYGGGELSVKRGTARHLNVGENLSSVGREPETVGFMSGCCVLIKTSSFEQTGLLPDKFFVYWEDADWSARVVNAGLKIRYVPLAVVNHEVSTSLGVNSPTYVYYIIRNQLLFISRNTPIIWKPVAWFNVWKVWIKEFVKVFVRYRKDILVYLNRLTLAYVHHLVRRYGKL